MPRITTLLIANRGEIARRIMRTARDMGIRTVAVYSEPDAHSPHVADADLAVALGGSTSAESYLDISKILDAVARSGADAVHPGYGFLAENAAFAEALNARGVVFVGPRPQHIADMGLKDRAKAIARSASVPVLPDAEITGEDPDGWLRAAESVGYPLLVKATAGGGGKGMRRVDAARDLVDAVLGARREAGRSFGADAVFLERYLPRARHVEVQVFGDAHGNAVHLGERECSVQRRHQKVLEESPSPAVTPQLRARMGATSAGLVRELGYLGAGTVEYLLDDRTGEFFFLEMNTRLQVEHPVTEEVTGLDLVRLQLRVARGEPLGIAQDDVVPHGHAIEVRLYAEDPARDYLPTPGRLWRYDHPRAAAGLRFEDGVGNCGEISAHYDPMLAKVIAHAETREEAATRLAAALDATQVHGTTTNRAFLAAILRSEDFLAGATHTDFLDRHPELLEGRPAGTDLAHLAAAVAVTAAARRAADRVTGYVPPGFRTLLGSPSTTASWQQDDGTVLDISYRLGASTGDTGLTLEVGGTRQEIGVRGLGPDSAAVVLDGLERACRVVRYPDGSVWVNSADAQSSWHPQPRLPEARDARNAGGPIADLPGTVVAVLVKPGDRVVAGQKLVVLEAMKMEHTTVADTDGVVAAVQVEVGQYVDAQTLLVALESEEAA